MSITERYRYLETKFDDELTESLAMWNIAIESVEPGHGSMICELAVYRPYSGSVYILGLRSSPFGIGSLSILATYIPLVYAMTLSKLLVTALVVFEKYMGLNSSMLFVCPIVGKRVLLPP